VVFRPIARPSILYALTKSLAEIFIYAIVDSSTVTFGTVIIRQFRLISKYFKKVRYEQPGRVG
jgi:hypothetical protein